MPLVSENFRPNLLMPPVREAFHGEALKALPEEIFYTPEQNKLADNLLKAFPDPKNLELAVHDNIDPEIGRTTSMSVDQLPSEVKAQISHINPETNQIVLKNGDEMAIPHGLMATPDGGLRRSTLADAPPPSAAQTATSFAASNAHTAAAAPGKTITVNPEFTKKAAPPTPAEQAAVQAAEAAAQRTAAAATAAKNAATQSQTSVQSNKRSATEANMEEPASDLKRVKIDTEQTIPARAPTPTNIALTQATISKEQENVNKAVSQAAGSTSAADAVQGTKQTGDSANQQNRQQNQEARSLANFQEETDPTHIAPTGKAGTHKNS